MEFKHVKPLGIITERPDEYDVVIEDETNKVYTETFDKENNCFDYRDCGKDFTYCLNNPWSDACDNIYTEHQIKNNIWRAFRHVVVYDTVEVDLWSEECDSEENALKNLDERLNLLNSLYKD